MTRLSNLQWVPRWVSQLGCLKSCCDYLQLGISDGWLYGGTGYAFVLNMHEAACPSSLTAWRTEPLLALTANLGIAVSGVAGSGRSVHEPPAEGLQRKAWDHARAAIDAGRPCYGWELRIPEYYLIDGYDETGYYFTGPLCPDGDGPLPWQELGRTAIGVLELYSVRPGDGLSDREIVRRGLALALEQSQHSGEWSPPQYETGLAGYDRWIRAVEEGTALEIGLAYNAAAWGECRHFATQFLAEARQRLERGPFGAIAEAQLHYRTVATHLAEVVRQMPFSPGLSSDPIGDDPRRGPVAAQLRAAREAEARGLHALAEIIAALRP
ncbi:MAG: hypothetical protein GF330_04690 [Candidatus Eisenbacteria bacterium]|nr:hypothetical protein [Candidatus Eisenbacteria bacterium]